MGLPISTNFKKQSAMTDLTDLDYAFIMCFKRSQRDNVALLRSLVQEQSEWCGSPVEYIGLNDVAHMLTGTVARMGILNTEHGMYRWYDGMRTEALSQNISGHDPLVTIFDELNIKEWAQPLCGFYIRHILNFADIIRWVKADDVPGLAEYREKNKAKWPIKGLDNPTE